MDLVDTLDRLASRLEQHTDFLKTEEATKHTLVLPLINALGFNVFDPSEVTPEFTADVGTKKGEKVDYAINIDGNPMILIECKTFGSELSLKHASQLYRYFSVTDARFGVLTNGTRYLFFSDIESPNKMDEKPFFEFDLCDFDRRDVTELKKFAKSNFDLENILSNASELKYAQQIQKLLSEEYESPTEDFVRLFTSRVYSGRFTSAIHDQFQILVKNAFRSFLADQVNSRLKAALHGAEAGVAALSLDSEDQVDDEEQADDDGIVTTQEEIEGFNVVRAILAKHVDPKRVAMRDTKSYCGILLDDNNRKPICRLHFNRSKKYFGVFDENKKETRNEISSPVDIFRFEEEIVTCVEHYDSPGPTDDSDTVTPVESAS
ncbi:restriction endonuclease [Rhodopirellula sp. SM50]|nr:type I restriction endonuclease [Rhodopirellula sp. SM50]PAY20550.1 restriction endonuclease [Rhodopirellula sp. SM50]